MPEDVASFQNSKRSHLVFMLCILVSCYWCLGMVMNIYRFAVVGAFYEILWLPMLGLLFVLPALSLLWWIKEKFNPKSLNLFSLVFLTITFVVLVFRNHIRNL